MEIEEKCDIIESVGNIEEMYHKIVDVGEGTFGKVYKAVERETREIVALKEIKDPDPDECTEEIRALLFLKHPTIVGLKKVVCTGKTVYLALEYMEESLHDLIRRRLWSDDPFSEDEVRNLSFQLFKGLDFMHRQRRFMHRDLKPANLLMNRGVVKISDLGTATKIDSLGPFHDYVTTRFYRAPEMLIRSYETEETCRAFVYDEKVDMWSAGTIIAELFRLFPLFMGMNSADQLQKICEVIGAPTCDSWMGGVLTARGLNIPKLEPDNGYGLGEWIPNASDYALDLIASLCSWDPMRRPSAEQALQHPFFTKATYVDATRLSCCVVPKTSRLSSVQAVQKPIY